MFRTQTTKTRATLAAAAALFVSGMSCFAPGLARGMQPTTTPAAGQPTPGAAEKAEEGKGPWSFELGATMPTAYVFRGYLDTDDKVIVQPEFTATYAIELDNGITLAPHAGLWGNFVEGDVFRETDYAAGVEIGFPKGFSLDIVYTFYYSPNNDFEGVNEILATLTHDDALAPHLTIARELDDSAYARSPGTYAELGIEPSVPLDSINKDLAEKLSLSVPINLGMSLDHYYLDSDGENTTFGYVSGGLHASYQLDEHLSLKASVDYVQMLADSTEAANHDGGEYKVIGAIGVGYEF